ncbi:MAG: hypothetical protein ACOC5D_07060 [Thermoplasmatota archaeon]
MKQLSFEDVQEMKVKKTNEAETEDSDYTFNNQFTLYEENRECNSCGSYDLARDGEMFLYFGPNMMGYWCKECGAYNLFPLPEGYEEKKVLESKVRRERK